MYEKRQKVYYKILEALWKSEPMLETFAPRSPEEALSSLPD